MAFSYENKTKIKMLLKSAVEFMLLLECAVDTKNAASRVSNCQRCTGCSRTVH